MSDASPSIGCPFCRGLIDPEATVCRWCGAYKSRRKWFSARKALRDDVGRAVFLAVIAAAVILGMIGGALTALAGSSSRSTSISCPVSDYRWPNC